MVSENVAAVITDDEFRAYVDVRTSGVTNMFAVSVVSELSGLDKKQCFYIMEHYGELAEKYPGIADS